MQWTFACNDYPLELQQKGAPPPSKYLQKNVPSTFQINITVIEQSSEEVRFVYLLFAVE